MPLARIITSAIEDSLELTMQLRARGYRVETLAPGQVPATPADLEVHLEECDSGQVISRTSGANSSEDLWVFVAPGALDERARPIRVIPLIPQDEPVLSRNDNRMSAAVLPFLAPEDDPIVADLESDLIVAEFETTAASPPTVAASISAPREPAAGAYAEISPKAAGLLSAAPADTPAAEETPAVAITPAAESRNFWIPKVPERPPITFHAAVTKSPRRARPVWKVALRTGPSFWGTAWILSALVVLAGVLGVVLGTRPPATTAGQLPLRAPAQSSAPVAPQPSAKGARVAMERRPASAPTGVPASSIVTRAAQKSKIATPKRSRPPRSSHERDVIAEDTVVFYDRPHGSTTSKASSQARTR
jgi:hypothetical protein